MVANRRVTYTALERTSVDVVTVQLADGIGSILMRVHLDEGEAAVRLEASLNDIAKVLEEGNQIVLSGIRSEVADIAGGLPLRSLLNDHVVGLSALSGELVVSVRSSWCHADGSHGRLLRERRLSLLVGPVAANSARAQPFSIHAAQSLFSLPAILESDESVATGAASLHVPHHTSLGNSTKSSESLGKDFVIYLIGQITHKDVEMVGSVFFGNVARLVGPVDTNFL